MTGIPILSVETNSSVVPTWNRDDLRLIATGRGNTANCSAPDEAKVFLANRILSDWNRLQSGQLHRVGVEKIKWKLKLALQARQILGSSSILLSTEKLSRRCEQFLVNKSISLDQSVSVRVETDRFDHLMRSGEHWIEIQAVSRQLKSLGADLILQGSQSDGTTTEFSDIDLILFGNPTDKDQQQLKLALDQIILVADPLQHHGTFFYSRDSQLRFSESTLPLETFRRATAIAEAVELEFRILNDRYSPASTLWSFIIKLKNFISQQSTIRGMWDWKFKISQFLLIPALLAAVRGKYLYKGDSFAFASSLYSVSAWQTIDELTRIRQEWRVPRTPSGVPDDSYLQEGDRAVGRLKNDPWQVPDSLAMWKHPMFRINADAFLDETLILAGLV